MHIQKKMLLTVLIYLGLMLGALYTTALADDIGYINANGGLRLRVGPGINFDIVTTIPNGQSVKIIGYEHGWLQGVYNGNVGFMHEDYVIVRSETPNRSNSPRTLLGSQIVQKAKQYLGTRYVYGGTSPKGFDCSGLTYYVYKHFGYTLNRTAAGQATQGVYISKANLQLGDLVFFAGYGGKGYISHVGVYVGNNNFIHAPKPGKSVEITSLNTAYYANRYSTARRIIR